MCGPCSLRRRSIEWVSDLRALLVDWGGVLTLGLDVGIRNWATHEGVALEHFRSVMTRWVKAEGNGRAPDPVANPIPAIERGELTVPDFERRLAADLAAESGRPVQPEGLLSRMFSHFEHAPAMNALVWRARKAGLRTGLVSNSWGDHYRRDGWEDMFDVVAISGEVGMRKPDPEIYLYACERIGMSPSECVFVDDLRVNVDAAAALGMVGIHHRTYEQTAAELEALFGVALSE